jgi:spore germination protein KB
MEREIITKKQCIAIMVAFLLGSSLVLGAGGDARRDAWIAVLAAMVISLPVFFVYARLVSLFPGKGLYEILPVVFGSTIGKIMVLPYIWYAFHLGALVIRNFSEFIMIVSLPDTPQYAVAILMTVLSIWAVKAGIEVIGRWSAMVLPVIIIAILLLSLLLIPSMELKNIKPVLSEGIEPVVMAAFSTFSFPFAEMVLFTVIFGNLKNNSSAYKIYYWSLFIGGMIILWVTVRNLLVLGAANVFIMYFPSYVSVRLINIGNFLQRIEVLVVLVFMLSGFVKVCICLLAAGRGIAKVLNFNNYRRIVAPVGLLMMIFSLIVYSNTKEMFEWANKIYSFYAIPFEVILPLTIWIAAEIKIGFAKN